jgi:hemolysin type calcium-binding protein
VGSTGGDLEGASAGFDDAFVRKYSLDGSSVEWTDQFGWQSSDAALGVTVDSSELYVVGHAFSIFNFNAPATEDIDAFVAKFATLPEPDSKVICGEPVSSYNLVDGTDQKDNLVGTDGNDLILGFGGNDIIKGKGGNDCLIGGTGEDRIYGNEGNDELKGNSGDDWLRGGDGKDELVGGKGDDRLNGGANLDRADGEAGTDSCLNTEKEQSCES